MAAEMIRPEDLIQRTRERARTINVRRLAKSELERGRLSNPTPADALPRPRTWGECQSRGLGVAHPCPYVSCSKHLFLEVDQRTGSIKLNFPDLEPDELAETCALAVAEKHPDGITLEQVGETINVTRERTRQIETRAVAAYASALKERP